MDQVDQQIGIIRYAGLKERRWRNGGGVTREIACGPAAPADNSGTTTVGAAEAAPAGTMASGAAGDHPGTTASGAPAPGDDWGWRISVANVDKPGGFSSFPGVERILTVIDGELLLLTVDGVEQGLEKHRPFRFDGGADTSAALPTGPIRDLNVMTTAGFRAHVAIVELSRKHAHPVFDGQHAVLLQGQATAGLGGTPESPAEPVTLAVPAEPVTLAVPAEPVTLGRLDAVVGNDEAPPEISGRGFLAVVSIDPV